MTDALIQNHSRIIFFLFFYGRHAIRSGDLENGLGKATFVTIFCSVPCHSSNV